MNTSYTTLFRISVNTPAITQGVTRYVNNPPDIFGSHRKTPITTHVIPPAAPQIVSINRDGCRIPGKNAPATILSRIMVNAIAISQGATRYVEIPPDIFGSHRSPPHITTISTAHVVFHTTLRNGEGLLGISGLSDKALPEGKKLIRIGNIPAAWKK